jgi:hypothetical protein
VRMMIDDKRAFPTSPSNRNRLTLPAAIDMYDTLGMR